MKIVFRVVNTILTIVLTVLLIINLWFLVSHFALKQNPPQFFGFSPLTVASGSMAPSIQVGDMILIKQSTDFAVGDVVTYRKDGTLITHKIVSVSGQTVVTQGTANMVSDAPIQSDQIVGTVVVVVPRLGMIFGFLRTPVGLLLMILLVIICFKLNDLFKTRRRAKKRI